MPISIKIKILTSVLTDIIGIEMYDGLYRVNVINIVIG
ncbi:hypothetical protein EMUR_01345 [Ehrlichia muris AS145]|uniref:Uncharacterized protein n=1 Tax=Ehrlichia muris AS145 TaxID=1423892 RepID=V9R8Q9_9RICK|nr:hypothetical protein EMUR_01345 [Ehrlichia muris AS145]